MLSKLYNIWQKCSWENLQHIHLMLLIAPIWCSYFTAGKQSAIQLCTYMWICSVNSSHNVNHKNVQAEQNHSNSQCLRKYHNLCSKCLPSASADTQQQRLQQRLVEAWSAMPQRVMTRPSTSAFAVVCRRTLRTSYDSYVGIVNLNHPVHSVYVFLKPIIVSV